MLYTAVKISVVDRSKWDTSVRVRTMGMKVPKSPTAPESSGSKGVLRPRWRRHHRWWSRGPLQVVAVEGSMAGAEWR
uniref:Uncharacterized protein n=1 Tax=Rhizophora mucronata TaxID=61149 RepID=A0A2P2PC83_RHIMU